jgi:diacylglycerol kinase (ATP)
VPQNTDSLPLHADRVLISVNPTAGSRSAQPMVDRLIELLRQRGFQTEILTELDTVAERANRWHTDGRLRALVGVGGDGTAAELANRVAAGVPLTMLPAGNENLLARYLNLGRAPETVCQTIADGALVRLDAGKAGQRIFLLMIGCGFDAEVVRRVHDRRTGHIRRRNYFKPIWDLTRSYEYPELRVYWGNGDVETCEVRPAPAAVRWLFAFNLPCYGGGLRLAPQADGADGLLDVCAFRRGSLWHALRYTAAVLLGRHQVMADCTMRRVRRLRVTSEAEVPYQLDGDPGGLLPVDVEVLPGRLALVVPATQAARFRGRVAGVDGHRREALVGEPPDPGVPGAR